MTTRQQNHKTKQYWDSFYSNLSSHASAGLSDPTDQSFEWIVANSPILLDEILGMLLPSSAIVADDDGTRRLRSLEIGCGVSELSRCLLQRLLRRETACNDILSYEFMATDVSQVCINHCRQRDNEFIHKNSYGHLHYETLDILTTKATQLYNVILDKGTLDTFLFRSKRTNKGSELYPHLLLQLLNNIHAWLKNGGKYIIISPRGRIKAVRDYVGFTSVRRISFDEATLGGSILMQSNSNGNKKNNIYIYECKRNDSYNSQRDEPFRIVDKTANDESKCTNCNQTFKEFRGNVKIEDQGKIVWIRKWENHLVHCKGAT
eukprot:scaffold107994_cov70-Cyclotella_meneghiniana.AAC.3